MNRAAAYFAYLIDAGGLRRYGSPDWKTPERRARIDEEFEVITRLGYEKAFIMLADVMNYVRREGIASGPGRGSVGGCYTAYLTGIHEIDSIEFDLLFERFLNAERVSFPDIDLDFSQKHRQRVIDYVVDKYSRDGQIVLQVPSFARASGRAIVDTMLSTQAPVNPEAGAIATNLKKCFPEKGSITGGVKAPRELHYWLYEAGHGDKKRFEEIATNAGWLDTMLKIDSFMTHLGKHAAGVVILNEKDLSMMPLTSADGQTMMAGYDMYSLDDLGVLKWDFLGLRTLDVIFDADRLSGGEGTVDSVMALWRENMNDPRVYEQLQESTLGIFQVDTHGFTRTIQDFQPSEFEHLVQLGALYRPGALDYRRESDGKNMVEVFIDRHHGREPVSYDVPALRPVLENTHGILLYQEQQMKVAQVLAGFTLKQADSLRKAIGKKRPEEMAKLIPLWNKGIAANPDVTEAIGQRWWDNIEAAARYSWNRSHSVEYGVIMWLTAWFKSDPAPAPFFTALLNSYEGDKDRMADTIAEARQRTTIHPPDVNLAIADFTVTPDRREIVFGLNGIKGMGDSNRSALLANRAIFGEFQSFEDFCRRLPSFPIHLKLALVACGAFDKLEQREHLLSTVPKSDKKKWIVTFECGCTRKVPNKVEGEKLETMTCQKKDHGSADGIRCEEQQEVERWTVAEHINHNRTLKKPRDLPPMFDWSFPSGTQLASGEMESMGFYISAMPLEDVAHDLAMYGPNVVGGEVERIHTKVDKNQQEMGWVTVITPALTKKRITIFGSVWPQLAWQIEKGKRLLFRGRVDGDGFIADVCWEPGDYRHVRKLRLNMGGEERKIDFDGSPSVIRTLEGEGWRIRAL